MDKVYLRNYTVTAKHGYYKEEHEKPQRFVVSITVDTDLRGAGTSDNLAETLNYELLRKIAHDILLKSPHDLVESLAEEMAEAVLKHERVHQVEVEISKPEVWNDSIPGVIIVRSN
jgi:dihydroneopterin aldolase